MKAIIVFCMLLIAMPVFAGTYKDDFENEQDLLNDCNNGVWTEDINFVTWENGSAKVAATLAGGGLATGDNSWKDYTIECKVKQIQITPQQGSSFNGSGLVLRHPCLFCAYAYFFALKEKEAGIYPNFFSTLDSSPFELELGKWYSLKAAIQGDQLEFYVDDKLVAKAKDDSPALKAGKAGFGTFGTVLFDDFVMTGPEVKDGGHWDPKAHDQLTLVKPQNKLAGTWGQIKSDN